MMVTILRLVLEMEASVSVVCKEQCCSLIREREMG